MTTISTTPEKALYALAKLVNEVVAANGQAGIVVVQAIVDWASQIVRTAAPAPQPQIVDPVVVHAGADGRPAVAAAEAYWMYSPSEESWSNGSKFVTREEAIAEGIGDLAQSGDLEPGGWFFTGITVPTTVEGLSESRNWGDDIDENINEWLYDNFGESAEEGLDATKEMTDELTSDVGKVVRAWLIKHNLTPKCWLMEKVQKHFVDACDCTTRTPEAKGNLTCSACKGSGLVLADDEQAAE